jgi:glycosyltransferase involved in cell wall biosynthesis
MKAKVSIVLQGVVLTGGVRVALQLAEGLGRHFDVKVLTSGISPDAEKALTTKYKVTVEKSPLPSWSTALSPAVYLLKKLAHREVDVSFDLLSWLVSKVTGYPLNAGEALRRLIRSDVAVATWFPTAIPVLQSDARPMILMQDFPEQVEESMGRPGLRLFRTVLRAPLSFLSISSYITELIRSENPSARIYYIGDGIDSEAFYPRKVDKGSELTVSVILRRASFKGPDIAVQALNMAYRRVKFRALLISEFSEGELRSRFRPEFPYVYYRKGLTDEELARIYSSSDVFLFTSRAESFGLVPLEAMACGAAVVSTDAKGNRDYMVNGYNALVAKTHDPAELADLLVEALTNGELRQSLVAGGLETAKKWDFRNVVERAREAIERELQEAEP